MARAALVVNAVTARHPRWDRERRSLPRVSLCRALPRGTHDRTTPPHVADVAQTAAGGLLPPGGGGGRRDRHDHGGPEPHTGRDRRGVRGERLRGAGGTG